MTTPKKLLIPPALLLLLGAALYLVPSERPGESKDIPAQPFETRPLLPKFDPNKVRAVAVSCGGASVRLEKRSDGWRVTSRRGRPANGGYVYELLRALENAEIVMKRTGSLGDFWLNAERRAKVELRDAAGRVAAVLFVGKGAGWPKAFACLSENGEVFEVNQSLDNLLGLRTEEEGEGEGERRTAAPDYWYDLRILRGDRRDLIGFEIETARPGGKKSKLRVWRVVPGKGPVKPETTDVADMKGDTAPLVEQKKKTVWKILEPVKAEADRYVCKSVCATALPLNVKGYADGVAAAALGFDRPRAVVRTTSRDGTVHCYRFGAVVKDKQETYLRLDDRQEVYRVGTFVYESMVKTVDELKKKSKDAADSSFGPPARPLLPTKK